MKHIKGFTVSKTQNTIVLNECLVKDENIGKVSFCPIRDGASGKHCTSTRSEFV